MVLVSLALAFTERSYALGSVYCTDIGVTCSDLRNFRVDQNGLVLDVCMGPEFITDGADCIKINENAKFSATPAGQ